MKYLPSGDEADGVVEGGVGQPDVLLAVQARPGGAASSCGWRRRGPCTRAARRPRRRLTMPADLEGVIGHRRQQLAADVVEVEVAEAACARRPTGSACCP